MGDSVIIKEDDDVARSQVDPNIARLAEVGDVAMAHLQIALICRDNLFGGIIRRPVDHYDLEIVISDAAETTQRVCQLTRTIEGVDYDGNGREISQIRPSLIRLLRTRKRLGFLYRNSGS